MTAPTTLTRSRSTTAGTRTAGSVMNRQPPTADQNTSLWGAWGRLRGVGCRHLVVVDSALRPLTVLEERDLALRWPPGPFEAQRILLHQVIDGSASPPMRWPRVRTGADMATVARAMLAAGTDAVPVVDDHGRLAGLVTARDCVQLVAER